VLQVAFCKEQKKQPSGMCDVTEKRAKHMIGKKIGLSVWLGVLNKIIYGFCRFSFGGDVLARHLSEFL
jgi:hypothetical protein